MDDERPLLGRTVGVTADRRAAEQARLLSTRGAEVVHGPTMVTIDLSGDPALRTATEALVADPPDVVVATTGTGVRLWLEAAEDWGLADGLAGALSAARIVARGAKAASAVRGAGFEVWWRAPEERMDQVVAHLAEEDLSGARVAVQLFEPDHPATTAIAAMASSIVEVPVYRWLLPEDRGPALRLVERAVRGELDAVTFTSQPAVRNLFRIADDAGLADELRAAFAAGMVASCVGPVCAEAASEVGIDAPVWPEPNRLVAQVRQLATLLDRGRAAADGAAGGEEAPARLWHLALAGAWAAAVAGDGYDTSTLGRSVAEEGFTHCAHARQVAGVAERYYRGVAEPLVLLEVDPARLSSPVVEEVPPGAVDAFPHVYGPLDVGAVVAVHPVGRTPDGGFVLPAAVSGSGSGGPST